MNTIEAMREFFGWCSVINIGLLMLSSIFIIALRGASSRIHGKMFNLDKNIYHRYIFNIWDNTRSPL